MRQLTSRAVCRIFVEELVRSVLGQRRHLSVIVVGIHDYAGTAFVCWEDHDGVVLFFKRVLHFLRDVGLWWFRLLKDIVDISSDSVCVLSVQLSDG